MILELPSAHFFGPPQSTRSAPLRALFYRSFARLGARAVPFGSPSVPPGPYARFARGAPLLRRSAAWLGPRVSIVLCLRACLSPLP